MIYALVVIMVLLLILAPQWWVRYVLSKHSRYLPGMPGNGEELAKHLLSLYQLQQVKVEAAAEEGADHYDPKDNIVRLSPSNMDGKSLTAIAVAAHEVGHAIQFNRNEPVSHLRKRYLTKAHLLQKIGISFLMLLPLIGAVVRVPHVIGLTAFIGVMTMLISVFIYLAILPEEWDASFNKALPMLQKGNYVPKEYLPAIKQILRACALTYVAAALADILRLWRWIALLKYMR
jgi:Zn-dependent membrane protease YugP